MKLFDEYKEYVTNAFEAVSEAVEACGGATRLSGPSYSNYEDFYVDGGKGYSIISDYSLNGYECRLVAQVALNASGKRYHMSLEFCVDHSMSLCVGQTSVLLNQNRTPDECAEIFNKFLSEKLGNSFSGSIAFEPIPGQNGPMPKVHPKVHLASSITPK